MAFEDLSKLKDEIADWLNREDLTDKIASFIRLFEARAARELRTDDMLSRSTGLTADDASFDLPDDWKETIAFMSEACPEPLEFVTVARSLELRQAYRAGGVPTKFYTKIGPKKLFLIPAPSVSAPITVELIYRAALPPLTDEEPTNWLLTKSPDLYLYGALAAAEPYLKNDDRFPMWSSMADKIIGDMNFEAERASFPQGKLRARFKSFG